MKRTTKHYYVRTTFDILDDGTSESSVCISDVTTLILLAEIDFNDLDCDVEYLDNLSDEELDDWCWEHVN